MPDYTIPNLRNACRVMTYLSRRKVQRGTSDVAKSLGLPRTSLIRILNTLEQEGMVRKYGDGYRLGPALIGLGAAARNSIEVREVARPFLAEIAAKTGDTCHLAIPFEPHSLIVEVERGSHPLTAASQVGTQVDLHCSATGKVFLAYLFHDRLEEVLPEAEIAAHTPNTLAAHAELRPELEKIRARGYAIDEQEYFLGVRCIAAPIFDHEHQVIAAIGLTSSIHRFKPERTDEFASLLREATLSVSRHIGLSH